MNSFEQWLDGQNEADRGRGMTRRERLLRRVIGPVAVVSLSGLAIFAGAEGSGNSADPYDLSHTHRVYTARLNDTLFGIAERAEPDQDPRQVTERIIVTIEGRDDVDRAQAETLHVGEAVPLPADSRLGQLVPEHEAGQ